jgi:hypothetical protein
MFCVDSILMQHVLKCTQRYSSLKLRTGGEGWTAICLSSRALCEGHARNEDKDEVTHALSGPTA